MHELRVASRQRIEVRERVGSEGVGCVYSKRRRRRDLGRAKTSGAMSVMTQPCVRRASMEVAETEIPTPPSTPPFDISIVQPTPRTRGKRAASACARAASLLAHEPHRHGLLHRILGHRRRGRGASMARGSGLGQRRDGARIHVLVAVVGLLRVVREQKLLSLRCHRTRALRTKTWRCEAGLRPLRCRR
eukprot:1358193-Rhodomonas_salina.2